MRIWMWRVWVLVAVLAVAGCSATYRNHGYVPAARDLAAITPGVDTQATVAAAIGQPTTAGILDASGWYYVRSRVRSFAFYEPQEIDRQVVAISFDPAGRVTNIERFGLEDGRVVTLERRVTDDNRAGVGFLRQAFGNLGRFDAESIFGGG
ncbi:MAG: outer membrane protein assembly factor BamE [Pseudomonadota bacterium]